MKNLSAFILSFALLVLCLGNISMYAEAQTDLPIPPLNPSIAPQPLAQAAPAVTLAMPLASQEEIQTRIFKLVNSQAQMLTQILQQIAPHARIVPDARSNSIIVTGNNDEQQQIEQLLQNLDGSFGSSSQTASSNLAYRVYAIEVPLEISSDTLLRQDFDADFRIPGNAIFSSLSQLKSSLDSDITISDMQCSYIDKNVDNPEPFSRLRITGSLPSADKFQKLIDQLEKITNKEVEVTVSDLQFRAVQDSMSEQQTGFDNPFYGKLQEALNAPDSASTGITSLRTIKKALNNLLGENLLVRGYWFGNSSLPGECSAPIGEWKLELNAFELEPSQIPGEGMGMGMGGMGMGGMGMGMGMSGMMGGMGGMGGGMMGVPGTGENANRPRNPEFKMEIHLMAGDAPILSNTVNARIGRPVIVGYTRKIGEYYAPGALVVIPEADFLESEN